MTPRGAFIGVTVALAVGSVLAVVLHNNAPRHATGLLTGPMPDDKAKRVRELWGLLNTSLGIWAKTDDQRKVYIRSVNGLSIFDGTWLAAERYNEILHEAHTLGFQQ